MKELAQLMVLEEEAVGKNRRKDERKFPRLDKMLRAGFQTCREDEARPFHLFLLDISEGGLRVNTDEDWDLGGTFLLTLPLASFAKNLPVELTVECEVRWKKSLHGGHTVHGLQFVNKTSEQIEVLKKVLASLTGFGGRLHKRTDVLLPIEMELEKDRASVVVIRNISVGGVGFRSKQSLEKEAVLKFRLPAPGAKWVTGEAKVAWRSDLGSVFEYGAEFINLSEESISLVGCLIKDYRD